MAIAGPEKKSSRLEGEAWECVGKTGSNWPPGADAMGCHTNRWAVV